MNKNITTIVFDFDGTLRDTSIDYLPESTLEALRLLRKKYKVFLATGRSIHILSYPGLDLNDFDGIICNNGASGYDSQKNLLFSNAFSQNQIHKILDFAKQHHISLTIQSTDLIYSTPFINEYHARAYEYFNAKPEPIKQYEGEDVLLINAYQHADFDYTSLIKDANICVISGPTTHVDFMMLDMDKTIGIKQMMEYHGVSGDYIAFGDQENDYQMLKNAKISIAVKDRYGSKRIQEMADYVCEGSAKNGILEIIQLLKLV